ncbi:hypothetical protein V493_02241 [Pseudogymnoascus sp. VKM F-4281 (FW-2241)]|nr:hypothetical protein V493_02241 [Pseudogymnoascus sp. VKM F-4281 (FW-2241)]
MPRTLEAAGALPKISFTNWILGGSLVTVPTRERVTGGRLPNGDADKGLKPKYSFINEKRYYQNRRVSRDKATDTEKKVEKGDQNKEPEVDTAKMAVPKDEIAKKEEQDKQAQQASGWTKAQDEKILAMKKAGNSWKMIAQEVGASKKDATNRFKELSKAGEQNAENDDPLPFGDMPGMFTEDQPTEHPKPQAKLQKKGKGEKGRGKGDNGGKGEKGEKDKVLVDTAALEAEHGKKVLVPDAIWTIGDLEVLANVEERYRELKWMHVQAGFYNMTGRMVGSEVIKAKFEQG